jgi:hypothetical protein
MAKFELTISLDNAAFAGNDRCFELARILHSIAYKVETGAEDGLAIDSNGNRVGVWDIAN